jgi:hypothetical protein
VAAVLDGARSAGALPPRAGAVRLGRPGPARGGCRYRAGPSDPDRRSRMTCWTGRPGGGAASSRAGRSAAASGSVSWRPCGWSTSGPRKSSTSSAARSWSTRRGCAAAGPRQLIVTKISHGARPKVAWRDERGRAADAPLGAVSPDERMRRLFTEGEDGLGPCRFSRQMSRTPVVTSTLLRILSELSGGSSH